MSGNSDLLTELEQKIAKHHGGDAALLFSSGYCANLGLMSIFTRDEFEIYYDEFVHASVRDGIRLSGARSKPFRHNDLRHLKTRLESSQKHPVVVVESIYSMSGQSASLQKIAELCDTYQALLIVDEAHAAGLVGRHGAGLVYDLGLTDKVFARTITYGKAFGCFGASIVGSHLLKEFLVNYARSVIYSTSLPPISASAISKSYDLISLETTTAVQDLWDHIQYFKDRVQRLKLDHVIHTNDHPIQNLFLPLPQLVEIEWKLRLLGFETKSMRSPTVKRGTERIRLVLHAFNERKQMDELLHHIGRYI